MPLYSMRVDVAQTSWFSWLLIIIGAILVVIAFLGLFVFRRAEETSSTTYTKPATLNTSQLPYQQPVNPPYQDNNYSPAYPIPDYPPSGQQSTNYPSPIYPQQSYPSTASTQPVPTAQSSSQCPQCNTMIPANAAFCPNCGYRRL